MPLQKTDLTNCDIEPIHIPGQIQSHGFLIAIDHNCIIKYHSENISKFLPGIAPNIVGQHINDIEPLIGKNEPPDFIRQLISFGRANKSFDQTNPFYTDISGNEFYLIISPSGADYLLEFEPAESDLKMDVQKMVGHSISGMLADKDLGKLLNSSAIQIKSLIGYDRVMVYRFADDGHGEVIAEAKNDNLPSWLGLHYPASDIPVQARELYKLNLTRLITNVDNATSKIVTHKGVLENEAPLDLTYSQLRAVSPIHIQYLKNMGVQSSFSISLIYKKELWGLIACHNYTPRFIDFKSRESSKLIGQILSSALEFRQDEANQFEQDRLKTNIDLLSRYMLKSNSIEDALTGQDITILDATNAKGAVLLYENSTVYLGKTPNEFELQGLLNWIKHNVNETFYYTNELPSVFSDAAKFKNIGSGIMVLTLSAELNEYIIWFKPEHIETITWAGNPDKPAEVDVVSGLLKISPRHSFEAWSQQVSGKSEPWSPEEIKSAMRLKAEVTYAINQKASAIRLLNEKLKDAYDELDTFSYTISHDLKNPISTIKGYSQLLSKDSALDPKVKDVLQRIVNKTDKMNEMINEVLGYSKIGRSAPDKTTVDIGKIIRDQIQDLKVAYNTDKLKVKIGETPAVQGDPVMLSQVFANLLSNAVKYSLPTDQPEIIIEGKENEHDITYSIKDNGVGIDIKNLPNVFELFKRMDNVQDIEGSGVGLAIVKRIVEKHKGKIWADSELGKGTTFFVSFKKH